MSSKIKGIFKQILGFLIGALLGAGSVLLFIPLRESLSIASPSFPIFLLVFISAIFLSVLLHELGHMAAGKFAGYRFLILTVGPLMAEKRADSLRFGINRHLNVAGGLTLMMPDGNRFDNRELALFIAGGPAASVLAGALLIGLPFLLPATNGTGSYNLLLYSLLLTGVISALIGLLSLVPEQSGDIETDGKQLLDLRRGGQKAEVRQLMMQTTLDLWSGVRPSELSRELIERLLNVTAGDKDSNHLMALLLAYLNDIDSGRTEEAGRQIDRAVEIAKESNKKNNLLAPTILVEAAFFEAIYRENPGLAKEYGDAGRDGYTEKSAVLRMDAGIAFAEGDHELAAEKATEALKEVSSSHDKGGAAWEEEVLRSILSGQFKEHASAEL